VVDRFEGGLTIGGALDEIGTMRDIGALHGRVEEAVLDLIAGDDQSEAIERVA
jgi:hypothetical protein